MKIIKDLKSIRVGEAKARRDIAAARIFLKSPERWECEAGNPLCADDSFWVNLGNDVSPDDHIEIGAYRRARDAFMAETFSNPGKVIALPDMSDALRSLFEGVGKPFSPVPVELDGNETKEQILEKARRAVADEATFREITQNENIVPENPENPEQSNQ